MIHAALLFSFMGAMAHYLSQYYDWKIVTFSRNLIAFLFSFIFLGTFTFNSREFRSLFIWLRCFIGGFGVLCTFYALTHTSISIVVSIMNTAPIWVAVIRRVFYREMISGSVWVMVLLGVFGVGLIEMPALSGDYLPLFAANISAVCSALVQIFLHELSEVDSRKVVFLFSLVATLISAVLLAFVHPSFAQIKPVDIENGLFFLGMGVFGYGGQVGMTRAFALGHPMVISLAILWNVVFALILDILFFDRIFTLTTLLGVSLIILSSVAIKNR